VGDSLLTRHYTERPEWYPLVGVCLCVCVGVVGGIVEWVGGWVYVRGCECTLTGNSHKVPKKLSTLFISRNAD